MNWPSLRSFLSQTLQVFLIPTASISTLYSGYTAFLVVVDHLTKQAIFIPTHNTVTSANLAKLFVLHMFSKHSIPSHITSNCGSKFVSHFFRSLRKALDTQLHFTSGYHLEGNGQTEQKKTHSTDEHNLNTWPLHIRGLMGFSLKGEVLLIARSKPMPRSKSTPRFKSEPWYPLYSSLVFHHSQVPISVIAKHSCPVMILLIFHPQPKCPSPLIHNVMFLLMVTRWPHSTFWLYAPWQPVATHSRGLITLHHFSFVLYPFSIIHSCFNAPDPHHFIDPKSHDFFVSDSYSSADSLV